MAESQKGVGTDAVTALIAAILALANALDKKGALSFEEYRDALLSMYRENAPRRCQRGPGSHIRWHADSARTRDKESQETNVNTRTKGDLI